MALNCNTNDNSRTFSLTLYRFTFAVEAIGALVLMTDFRPRWRLGKANAVLLRFRL